MLPFLKFVPLVLSTAALICLAVVFSACILTSSPQDLFFMEVKLTKFPKIDHLNLVRSFGLPGVGDSSSPLQQGNIVDSITGSAENAVNQIGGHVQDLSDQLYSLLPEYYAVGLWSYCEGKQGAQAFANCSRPSAAFSFNLVDLLSSCLGQANGVLADWTQPVLKGYRGVLHWIVAAYIMAFITAFIAVVTGLVGFPLAKLVAIISSAVSSLLIIGASVMVTIMYQLLTRGINSMLEQAGISASLGPRVLAASWLGVAFSVGSSLFWIVERCCCCCL
ncbi:actin cortical patch SUR7/pH-response regulator pali [Aspergillus granulosus]|uniref:Actin cortical patch SUR7/pH-response regulator pali n=1 Tax=Aspergillus granulosus TaxID=176169 RepID=A0ABR4GRX1_9EURO